MNNTAGYQVCICIEILDEQEAMCKVYVIKSKGLKMEPWGTLEMEGSSSIYSLRQIPADIC